MMEEKSTLYGSLRSDFTGNDKFIYNINQGLQYFIKRLKFAYSQYYDRFSGLSYKNDAWLRSYVKEALEKIQELSLQKAIMMVKHK